MTARASRKGMVVQVPEVATSLLSILFKPSVWNGFDEQERYYGKKGTGENRKGEQGNRGTWERGKGGRGKALCSPLPFFPFPLFPPGFAYAARISRSAIVCLGWAPMRRSISWPFLKINIVGIL